MDRVEIPAEHKQTPAVVPIEFWTDHEVVEPKDGKGEIAHRAVDWVEWAKKGTNGATTRDKIDRVRKDGTLWPVIEPFYQHWKKGQEAPASGTPLDVLPFLTKGQIKVLRDIHILSAEDLAEANDASLERIGMGARAAKDKAAAFVANKKGEAVVALAMAEKDREIADLRTQVAELAESIKTLAADRPKRGRPADVARQAAAE